ncbi:MAG: hypothetical protein ACPLVI_06325 [Thermoplasmata archaeon]|uniref:hypothetical protein n=1 Tax=Caldisericum sp. TaxID=2499687 RepID=UPI003C817DD8
MLESLSKYFKNIISINFDNNVNFHKFLNIYENIDFNYNDSIFDIKYEFLKSLDINLENLYKKINKERFYYEYISNILYQNYNFAKIEKNVTKVEENFLFPFKYKDPFLKNLTNYLKKPIKRQNMKCLKNQF